MLVPVDKALVKLKCFDFQKSVSLRKIPEYIIDKHWLRTMLAFTCIVFTAVMSTVGLVSVDHFCRKSNSLKWPKIHFFRKIEKKLL